MIRKVLILLMLAGILATAGASLFILDTEEGRSIIKGAIQQEVEDATGQVIDPYAGPMSQEETWWVEQGDPEGFPGLQCSD